MLRNIKIGGGALLPPIFFDIDKALQRMKEQCGKVKLQDSTGSRELEEEVRQIMDEADRLTKYSPADFFNNLSSIKIF